MTRCKHGQLQKANEQDGGFQHYHCRECYKTFKVKAY